MKIRPMATRERTEEKDPTASSGNVFADLGLDGAEELLAKAKVALVIKKVIRKRELTQSAAGKALGIPQAYVSRLLNGELNRFSTKKLMTLIMRCESDIDFVVKKRPRFRHTVRLSALTEI